MVARLLLPDAVFEPLPRRLFVTPDGFLLGTSFESLSLSPDTFVPLGTRHAIAILQPQM